MIRQLRKTWPCYDRARLTGDACQYLYADFKKRDGYRRSIALSREYGLYRQQFCGCRFSMRP
ncbi:MAG: epoxyqueuosine reductase QueH [Christensenellales bacterium]